MTERRWDGYAGDIADYCGDHWAHSSHDWVDDIANVVRPCLGFDRSDNTGLLALAAREVRAQDRGYTKGDVNHVLQPVIGWLRLHKQDPEKWPMTSDDLRRVELVMRKACSSELAWLAKEKVKHG